MVPELGHFAICLALGFAFIQCVFIRFYIAAVVGQFGFLAFAMLCLMASFLMNDMTVIYVREHSHHLLPLIYRVGAAWGGHEGSLLLWCLILSGWTLVFALVNLTFLQQRHCEESEAVLTKQSNRYVKGVSGLPRPSTLWSRNDDKSIFYKMIRILGLLSVGFITFLLFTSNPFARDFPTVPIMGDDLTPILQDPGLIFHPPMLYLGYVGFSICFAFAIASLMEGRLDKTWAKTCRLWVILPWSFLSCGIVLGSWWAYRELGWGGWWFWDPVENASLLPWLSATALIHSLIVSEKRDVFKGWTILLAIMTFALCLLGTFLVRSGVIVSVHAFANDPQRGIFLLGLLTLIIGSALIYYVVRIKWFYQAPIFQLFSRETVLLVNSVILITAVATILIGTFYPIMLDALHYEKISVGEPYFNTVFIPMMLPLLILMGVAPHVSWGRQSVYPLWKKLRLTVLMSVLLGFTFPWMLGFELHIFTSIGISTGLWIICATFQYGFELWKSQKKIGLRYWAMIVAHLGIAIVVLGVTINKSYSVERQVKMNLGETVAFMGYQFTFKKIEDSEISNYQSLVATFSVQKGLENTKFLSAEQRIYRSHDQVMSKAGILVNFWRDLYLVLGNSLPDGAWSIRLYYKPFVRWIWWGGFMLAMGGLLSVLNYIIQRKEAK